MLVLVLACSGKIVRQSPADALEVMDEMVNNMAKDWYSWGEKDWEDFLVDFMDTSENFFESNPSKEEFDAYLGVKGNMRLTIGVVYAMSEKMKTEENQNRYKMMEQAIEKMNTVPSYKERGKVLADKEDKLMDRYFPLGR